MTTKTLKTISAGLVALAIGGFAMTAPAQANGWVSVSVNPTNAKDARALQTGLQVYSIVNGIRNGGIRQHGTGNAAGLAQNGSGNLGVVHQKGHGHNGTLQQNGNGNTHGLFQFGRNTNGHVVQNGNGQTGATFQFGW